MSKQNKPKICLIYTGGTIVMERAADGVLRPPKNPTRKCVLDIAPEIEKLADFDFFLVANKDSTNMIPDDWKFIANEIFKRRNAGYDGFVVAHGTDTMHFSASAVALALGNGLNFPVVFTGAQTAPDIWHGDARVNLVRAFKVASKDIAEVVISFGDFVFRGCRTQKKDERRFDAFESPAFFPLAHITEDILISPHAFKRGDKTGVIEFNDKFSDGIFQVSLIPGLEPDFLFSIIDNEKCNGIILQSFGAGNVPSEGAYSMTDFIEKSTKRGKPVLITSQFPANATLYTVYETGRIAFDAGAIPTANMTSACATAKFRWVLGQDAVKDLEGMEKRDKIYEMMNKSYVGELTESENGL
jgi:L-asparaginase